MQMLKRLIHAFFIVMLTMSALSCADEQQESLESQLVHALTIRAERGNASAQYYLGMMFNNGIGTSRDPVVAFQWFKKAASINEPLAAYKAGCYFVGQFPGVVPVDYNKALAYKLIAAQAGYALAQHDVAVMYLKKGQGSEAIKWWKLAAEQGFFMSLFSLSDVYRKGELVAQDKVLAYQYFVLGASQLKAQYGESLSQSATLELEQLKNALMPEELVAADRRISDWKPKPTPLTLRAEQGIRAAVELVQGMGESE